ncbi:MAG: alpha-galactosidase [Victivallales bacterium]|nr:alpha-galactosidase [Victivallales bacterium]
MLEDLFKKLKCGQMGLAAHITVNGKQQNPKSCDVFYDKKTGRAQLSMRYDGFQDDIYFTVNGTDITAKRVLQNTSSQSQKLDELVVEFNGVTFGLPSRDDFFYHNENPRIYEVMTFPIDYKRSAKDAKDTGFDFVAGNRWADPDTCGDLIGASIYQPFPAILLSNYKTKHGLVHGTLSQKVCYHCYLVAHDNDTVKLTLFSRFKGTKALTMAPDRIITDEWYLGSTEHSDDLDHLFDNYTAVLRKFLPPMHGATDVNRFSMVWGSWNDGILRNISEEMLLQEARHIKKNFPMVEWIQVDDGYAVNVPPANGLGVPYEGKEGIDKKKFPNGMRHYTDEIRKIGLKPAIWIGGFCPKKTPIYKEHPDWFIDYDYRVPNSAPLDPTLPEVCKYMTSALDTLILEYGFDGVKQDFWSYAFEDSHDLFNGPRDRSGYELRDWWLKEFRKRLPEDAHFQSGCDIAMGNPFLGEFYTNYRYGIDIGSGNWDYVKTNFLWGVACFATHTNDLFVANSDSVGLFPGLNDTEAMFCLNYCLVTHSMVEIAGRLSLAPDSPRLKALKKAVCCPNNGADVFLACYDYRDHQHKIPEVLYFNTPFFALKASGDAVPLCTIGLFNIEETDKAITIRPKDFKLPKGNYMLTDVWTGERYAFSRSASIPVVAHGSRLLVVNHASGQQLVDSNVGAFDVTSEFMGKDVRFTFNVRYKQPEACLRFANPPKQVVVVHNDARLKYKVDGCCLLFNLPSAGELTIKMEQTTKKSQKRI